MVSLALTPGATAAIIACSVILFIILILVIKSIVIVHQATTVIVQKLGKYSRTLSAGIHMIIPILEAKVATVSLKEKVADFPPQPVITKDNVTMQIDTVVYFQITDPKLYTYGVERPLQAIENLTATTLRNIIGDLELDQTLTSRDTINTKMRSTLERKEALKLDIDPNTHPAWTGKRNMNDIGGGAADKFKKKFAGFTTKKA